MMLVLIVLFAFCTIATAQVVSFPRCNSDFMTMAFVYANPAMNPYDLFAAGKNGTCGKRARSTTGSGTYADPYILTVNLSRGVALQTPDCGVEQTGPTNFRLTVRAVFSANQTTNNDTDYTVACNNLLSPTTTTTPIPLASRSATYTCQAPSVILFSYSQTPLSKPFNIYAVGRESTCSKSANQGTGSGVDSDPYVLSIDVSNLSSNICGVSKAGTDTYSVVMYVQQFADVITVSDVSYDLTCNFTSAANQPIFTSALPVASKVEVREASLDQPTATLYVVASPGGGVLSTFAVGDDIRLAAQLLDGPATGLRVRECTVSPGPGLTPRLSILGVNGCSVGNNLVPPFEGQSPAAAQALTGVFDAFKFNAYDTVYFQCVADFCYSASDTACLGSHCAASGRRKRDINGFISDNFTYDVITAYVTVRGNVATNITGSTSHLNESSTNHNCASLANTDVVVVASLASALAVAVLVGLSLALKLRFVMSLVPPHSCHHQQCRHNQCDVSGQNGCRGEKGMKY